MLTLLQLRKQPPCLQLEQQHTNESVNLHSERFLLLDTSR